MTAQLENQALVIGHLDCVVARRSSLHSLNRGGNDVSKQAKGEMILDVSNPQMPVLYASNTIDITKDIVDLFDKNAASLTPAAGAAAPATGAPRTGPAANPIVPAPKPAAPPATSPTAPAVKK